MARNKGLDYQDIRELQDPGWRRAGSKTRPGSDRPFGGDKYMKDVYEPGMGRTMEREDAVINPYSDEIDSKAFDNMQKATGSASDKMFTESEYNINASPKDKAKYDAKAYSFLEKLYSEDKEKGKFENLNFSQFLENLNPEYIEEKFGKSRDDDPEYYHKAGDLLLDIYEGDVDQLKASASKFYKDNPSPAKNIHYQRNLKFGEPGFDRKAFDPETGNLIHTQESRISGRKVSY